MKTRLRNLRQTAGMRSLVRETALSPDDFVMPYFVRPGKGVRQPIASMPGQFQFSVDELVKETRALSKTGVGSIILFGIPASKDRKGTGGWAKNGIVQQAVRAVKDALPDLVVITDVCMCEYTDHGHCGILKGREVDNDATLPYLQKIALSHVQAGADIVAPSGMMDGVVAALRSALPKTTILSYAAKYASAFYGPFRQAAESAPQFGDRHAYQMDVANGDEAIREIDLDLTEGADIIMVKPALAYLDIIRRAKEKFGCPMAAYNVSGEYAMIKAAGERGWIDEKKVILEVLTSIKRAGSDFILTYFARGGSGVDNLKPGLEAILFTCDEPITLGKLKDIFPEAKPEEIREAVGQLKAEYDQSGRAFTLDEIAGGYQLLTRPQHADIIAKLKKAKADRKLSSAALETLAIIAYKQPIKRVDLEAIRGAASGELIRALMERNLVKIAGREEIPGSPLQYGTTKDFLDTFGINSLEDLPRPEEVK